MTQRPEEVQDAGAPATRGRRRAAMSGRDVTILRSLADRIDPADPGAQNNLGVVFFQKGLVDEAIAAFERALDLDPRLETARRNAEIAYLRTGHLVRRVSELEDRLRARPDDATVREALARTFLLGGDPVAAAGEWRRLLEDRPDSVSLRSRIAFAEARAGNLDTAEALIRQAMDAAPEDASLALQLAELLVERGEPVAAERALERALELEPEMAWAHALAGRLHEMAARPEEAEAARMRAARLDSATVEEGHLSLERYAPAAIRPNREPRSVTAALGHYARAAELRRKGEHAAAIRELERALAAGEDSIEVRQALAELRLLDGSLERAAAEYELLLTEVPDSPKLWNERGVSLHRQGRIDEALEDYRRAIKLDREYVLAWSNLGVALAQGGDVPRAERALRRAADLEPPPEILWNLALHLVREARPREAVDVCQRAVELDASLAESWSRLGGALFQADRSKEAREALTRALEIDPDLAEARYQLGFALSALGDFPGALRQTKRALELEPLYPAPRFRLLVDVHFEEGSLPAPEAERVERLLPGAEVRDFQFDPASLDRAFSDLAARARTAGAPAGVLEEARLALRRGQLRRAADRAARALAGAPSDVDALVLQADVFLARGLAGEALERYQAVLDLLRERGPAGVDRRRTAAASAGAARSLLALERGAQAAVYAREAAESGHDDGLVLLARAHHAAGAPDRAASVFEVALDGRTAAPADLTAYGSALLACERVEEARDSFRRAVTLDADAVAARVGLGRSLAALGDTAGAEAELRDAVDRLPSYADAALALAEVLWARGRRAEALAALVEFLELDPTHGPALLRLGHCLHEMGRPLQAEQALRRVLRLDPDNEEARSELTRVTGVAVEV